MGVVDIFKGRKDARVTDDALATGEQQPSSKDVHETSAHASSDSDNLSVEAQNEKEVIEHPDSITGDAQQGIQKAEAAALVWPKRVVYGIYGWIWVCFFMLALQSAIGLNVLYNAYSGFQAAPQISTANILSSIIGGVLKLPTARLVNIWGRAEGFLVFVGIYLLGMIIIASCNGPNGYAAGYTLYWIGYYGIYLILDIFMADTTGLKNRAFAFAFASTPFIATAFVGPLAAQNFIYHTGGWRWAYGAFAIIMPFVFVPLAIVFKFYEKKALKMGILKKEPSGRTTVQSIVHYIHEFDLIGALILMAGFVLFLLPFSLATYGRAEYKGAKFIAMVVIGILLLAFFYVWERFFARTHFVDWKLLKERTVLGVFCLAAILFFSFYSWDLYYYYFVEVVYNLDIAKTGYMSQIYNVGSCFWGVVFGIYVRYTKHFKNACLFFGLPLMFLGAGLMIHFRGQDGQIGYIIMCQIFIAFSGGTLVIGEDMAVMAAANRDGVPMMLAMLGLSSSVGGAIGYAVSGAIYQNTFPKALAERLPASEMGNLTTIYIGGATTQMLYPVGSEARDAINYAWGQSQKYGCISATAILILAIPCIAVWKNYSVDKKQNKGTIL